MNTALPQFEKVKGVHPGAILKRELRKRNIKAVALAKSIEEYPQTINAITKERRGINPNLSIKLGEFFHVEKEYFMLLQASYEVKCSLKKQQANPLTRKVRNILFWDTHIGSLDSVEHKRFIIQRVLEYGNESEIIHLIALYGKSVIKDELTNITNSVSPSLIQNVDKYINAKL